MPDPTNKGPLRALTDDASAYALYLRANEVARSYEHLPEACDLYQRCVELDPRFAPAWAHLGRCHRVIGKYFDSSGDSAARSEQALRRALELSPRLAVAHKFYAALEADTGHAPRAMTRLLTEAARHGNDPELFAGLVHACRYCGLFDESIAAHEEARRLDPNVPTSVEQTIQLTSDLERYLDANRPNPSRGGDEVIRIVGLGLVGRRDQARRELLDIAPIARIPAFKPWMEFLRAWLDRRPGDMAAVRATIDLKVLDDPEAMFQEGWMFCDAGGLTEGLDLVQRSIAHGYFVDQTLQQSRAFDPLRGQPAFQKLLADAEAGRERALAAFREAGGERLLGLGVQAA